MLLKEAAGRPRPPQAADTRIDANLLDHSFLGRALHSDLPLQLIDVQKAPEFLYRDLAKKQRWKSALAVPIRAASGQALGVISIYSKGEERYFPEHDCHIAVAFF